jgi:hypothetical protein
MLSTFKKRLKIAIAANENEGEFGNNFDSCKFVTNLKFRNLFVHDADL